MQLKLRTLLLPFFAMVFSAFTTASFAQTSGTTVSTDKLDYPPGATVFITGAGFGSSEKVTLQVVHTDIAPGGTDSQYHQPFVVTTMADGTFTATWRVPTDGDALGASLKLTADGQSSGRHAETFFTDGSEIISGTFTESSITVST
ncbi:MAG: hypothetical protein M3Y85_00020, partial [Bacteroidota bacterium]|nr:hypothetical protein [Bacteroidota bacterium]